MKNWLFSACAVLVFGSALRADQITLTTTAPPGTPITANPGLVSPSMFVRVTNNAAGDPPAAFMSAWQLRLVIVPDGGATGTVSFNSPTTQTFTAPAGNPTNYVFGTNNNVGIDVTNSGTVLTANDFALAAVNVPIAPGASLLQIDFLPSAGANGTFGIFAESGAGNTVFTNGVPATSFFTNVSINAGLVRIGEVMVVPVPEPASGLAAVAVVGLMARRLRRHG